MKTVILGSGAMGSLYGGYLSANNEVTLFDIWKEHIDKINADGLVIEEADGPKVFRPKAVSDPEEAGTADLVIVFVKSTMTRESLEGARQIIGPDTLVMSLQNGWGNHSAMEGIVKKENIIAGTTSHGATLLGPGHIRHAGVGMTTIGTLTGGQEAAERTAAVLREAGFETAVSGSVMKLIWHKLFINIGINAITALERQPNEIISGTAPLRQASAALVREAVSVACAAGMDFDADAEIESMYAAASATGKNRSSMLQDVERKRRTEITTINGAVVAEARKLGVPAPMNELMTLLIEGAEALYNA